MKWNDLETTYLGHPVNENCPNCHVTPIYKDSTGCKWCGVCGWSTDEMLSRMIKTIIRKKGK